MARLLIAILIVCYAIAFAFGAMSAIRWPSLMMFASLVLQQDPVGSAADIDWREIGLAFGAPYFLAALCLYASALAVSQKQKGAIGWYLMGCVSGFPCVFLVDFETGWWRDPTAAEGAVTGAAAAAVLLGLAVWVLRKRKPAPQKQLAEPETAPAPASVIVLDKERAKKPVRQGPVPAAIARQRAHFALEGRRMLARQNRR